MNNKQDFKFENDIDVYSSLEAQIKTSLHNDYLRDKEHSRNLQNKFGHLAFYIACAYLLCILPFVIFFFVNNPRSENVMIALLTTTTITVIALPKVALSGAYNDKKDN